MVTVRASCEQHGALSPTQEDYMNAATLFSQFVLTRRDATTHTAVTLNPLHVVAIVDTQHGADVLTVPGVVYNVIETHEEITRRMVALLNAARD